MQKIVDSRNFRTKNSEGTIFELESGEILIGFTDPPHLPKINSSHVAQTVDLSRGKHLVRHDAKTITIAVYE
jgi:hypothetical protein